MSSRKVKRVPMFPAFLDELADEGITSYKVNLSQRTIVYYARDSKNVEQ